MLPLRPNSGTNVCFQSMGLVVVAGGVVSRKNVVAPAYENCKPASKEESRSPSSTTVSPQSCIQHGCAPKHAEGSPPQSKPHTG